jgi:hypothetical protein
MAGGEHRLLMAFFRKRRIDLPLKSTLLIPGCHTVSDQYKFHRVPLVLFWTLGCRPYAK